MRFEKGFPWGGGLSALLIGAIIATTARASELPIKDGQKIAFMGDSITEAGAKDPVGYVNLVILGLEANGIKVTSIPAGISGHRATQMFRRLDRDVLSKKPDWMTLNCGVNDVGFRDKGVPLDLYKENVTKIIDQCHAAGVKVMILTATTVGEDQSSPKNQKLIAYNEILRTLAREKNCLLADLNADMQTAIEKAGAQEQGRLLTCDGVHMNPAGNRMMATGVLKAFGLSAEQIEKARKSWGDTDTNRVLADASVASVASSARVWPDSAPADCPFAKSQQFVGVQFTGRHSEYTAADTWYPSWASDDRMYSPFTDGAVEGVFSGSGYNFKELKSPVTGFAVIEGNDPLKLKIVRAGVIPHEPFPYGGQYPCGSLVHNGVWYYGTYCLDWQREPWDTMGPFVGFNISTDFGKTWLPEARTALSPLFGESAKDGRPVQMWSKTKEYAAWNGKSGTPQARVKIGALHFVDFGKNMEHSPDGKAYLVAQGAVRVEAYNSWAAADQVYLIRVKPSPETINDPRAYEFFSGRDENDQPIWTGDLSRIKPLLQWNDHMGIVTATYIPGLKKYLMCVTDGRGPKGNGNGPYDTYILESNSLTGPWNRVTYMKALGAQAYFVNLPSKFSSVDGRTLWICYAHGWSCDKPDPPESRYAMCLQEIRLLTPDGLKRDAAE